MKKILLLLFVFTISNLYSQSTVLLKQYELIKKEFVKNENNKYIYTRVIETGKNINETYDKVIDALKNNLELTLVSNILPNSSFTKVSFRGANYYFEDRNYNFISPIFEAEVDIKNNFLKITVYPKVLSNSTGSKYNYLEDYPLGEKDIELKKVKRKNIKLDRLLKAHSSIKLFLYEFDDLLSKKTDEF